MQKIAWYGWEKVEPVFYHLLESISRSLYNLSSRYSVDNDLVQLPDHSTFHGLSLSETTAEKHTWWVFHDN